MKHLYKLALLLLAVAATTCERRSLSDGCPDPATLIPVRIDWSQSGITPESRTDADFVHRVSLRFFPEDGSPAFDRYLEGNVFEGEIDVPAGRYSVVVYNEALDDIYWEDNVFFTDVDEYHGFAANIVTMDPTPYSFYTPQPGEQFVTEPLKLASWSLDFFEVTPQMLQCTSCLSDPDAMINALTKVVMRRLVTPVRIIAEVTNLRSAMRMEGALAGMSAKVFLASGITHTEPSTHLFAFTAPIWNDASQIDGRVERTFLSFGRRQQLENYTLDLSVTYISGEQHEPDQPLHYDVTDQVTSSPANGIEIRVRLSLPEVTEGIQVGDWDDEEIIIK